MTISNASNMTIREIPATSRTDALIASLTRLWDASVRTTHHFLTDGDIMRLRPFVDQGLRTIPVLGVAEEDGLPVGFIGVDGDKIEMLFVAADTIGRGVGHQLVAWATRLHGATRIDVNEQNAHAAAVYRHWGFTVYERTDVDDQDNAFPLLRMRR